MPGVCATVVPATVAFLGTILGLMLLSMWTVRIVFPYIIQYLVTFVFVLLTVAMYTALLALYFYMR